MNGDIPDPRVQSVCSYFPRIMTIEAYDFIVDYIVKISPIEVRGMNAPRSRN